MAESLGKLLDGVDWEGPGADPEPYLQSAFRYFESFPWDGTSVTVGGADAGEGPSSGTTATADPEARRESGDG